MKKNSIKNIRINTEVAHELGRLIRMELHDPRISLMTSVTDAQVATDLKTAKIYVSVLGSEQEVADTFAALQRAEGFLRHGLAQTLNLRHTPKLTFLADDSIAYGARMNALLSELKLKEDEDDQNNN
ncbi:MAG: 30S ribosome-binding factor RbfA [Lachnospiraceae bacterium]|nr:30S ribosome-binding factor RbfA [Lachnospiraceae bacterium]MDY5742640.1 30S ribosome-binding factor RbfA [Lachnospiraceae bacterium]